VVDFLIKPINQDLVKEIIENAFWVSQKTT
jgi:FixJ family two-component response regulator